MSTVSNPSHRQDRPMLGLGLFMANILLMIFISVLVRELSATYPLQQILLFRFALALLPFAVVVALSSGPSPLKTRRPMMHATRTVSGILSLSMLFYALSTIPIAEATILAYSAPIFLTIMAVPFLGEKIGLLRSSAVVVGFVGMAIIVQPTTATFGLGMMAGIGSAFFGAVVVIGLRRLGDTEPTQNIAVIYNGTGTCVLMVCCLLFGWVIPGLVDLGFLLLLGCLAMVQQYSLTASFRYSEASMLSPFEYSALIFAAIAGYVFWGEVPALSTWIGAAIITASGLFVIHREVVLKRKSTKPVSGSETLPGT
jgi:drug/metabolite transporter (DMT)-like permease